MSLNGQLANTLAVVSTFEEKSEAQTTVNGIFCTPFIHS